MTLLETLLSLVVTMGFMILALHLALRFLGSSFGLGAVAEELVAALLDDVIRIQGVWSLIFGPPKRRMGSCRQRSVWWR